MYVSGRKLCLRVPPSVECCILEKTKKLGFALLAVASLAAAAPASAATVQVLGTVQDTDLFTNVFPDVIDVINDTAFEGVTGSVNNKYRDVYTGTALADTTPYNAVLIGGTMTYVLNPVTKVFTMIWGSVDALNLLTLNLVGGGTETVTGQDLLDQDDIPVDAGSTNVIAQIFSTSFIESVTITSGTNSFEHSFNPPEVELAPIPLPAAGVLLIAAMGGLGVVARRRKSA